MANGNATPLDYGEIAARLKSGTIIPFFGAGASASCGIPSSKKLAELLVAKAEFPDADGRDNLALVASYLFNKTDQIVLNRELRSALLEATAEPGRLHHCLSNPSLDHLRFFVTTNYDDLVERALQNQKRSPWVVVDRGKEGSVWFRPPGGNWKEIKPTELSFEIPEEDRRPIVFKLHGSFDRDNLTADSFLITEEDYVDFLGRQEGGQLPPMLGTATIDRSFLFLGYALKDWNIRVLLRKLKETRGAKKKVLNWAIARDTGMAEHLVWDAQDVRMYDLDLDAFVTSLETALWTT